jgi:hypothetical protein
VYSVILKLTVGMSRATNFGRQSYFKIWLDCYKLKKKKLSNYAYVSKMSKNEKKKLQLIQGYSP